MSLLGFLTLDKGMLHLVPRIMGTN